MLGFVVFDSTFGLWERKRTKHGPEKEKDYQVQWQLWQLSKTSGG